MTAEVEHKIIDKKYLGDFKWWYISSYERGRGCGRSCGRESQDTWKPNPNPDKTWVDGKQVKVRLSLQQCKLPCYHWKQHAKVAKLRRSDTPHLTKGGKISSTVASIASICDDMIVMADEVVTYAQRVSGEDGDGNNDNFILSSAECKSATSGSVRNFTADRRKF